MSQLEPTAIPGPASQREAVSAQAFREVMCQLASGVTIITASLGDVPVGMTATAVCSVSAKPPMLFISLTAGSRTALGVEERKTFAVHLLPHTRQKYAEQFAAAGDHFADIGYRRDPATGVPILEDVLGYFLCEVERSVVVADHALFVGRVMQCAVKATGQTPLVYFDRAYGKVTPVAELHPVNPEHWAFDIGLPGWGVPT
jgi:flavin reductase (DIM6/NTAB) family NADH-FMN oxidoreductase RutF